MTRLSRPHASGGKVIERAAVLAEGGRSAAVLAWIAAHGAVAELASPVAAARGLHSSRLDSSSSTGPREPQRYVLPPGALS